MLPQSTTAENAGGLVEAFAGAKILCIGDVMLDRFIYGSVDRISPEAPIPVFAINKETVMLGGAGNVVRNIRSLGAEASIISVIGDDKVGMEITRLFGQEEHIAPYLLVEKTRPSTAKSRYIAGTQQLLRADSETAQAIAPALEAQLLSIAESEIASHDLLVLSDYGKGVLTANVVAALIAMAAKAGKPVFVDPKSRDFSLYAGTTLLSPNLQELSAATGLALKTDEEIIRAAQQVIAQHGIAQLLVTRSKQGMTLISAQTIHHIPARAREIYDVSGAGDTVLATLAVASASGARIEDAAMLANLAAGIVVGKVGTAVVYRTDLKTALYTQEANLGQSKILPAEVAADQVQVWRREGKKIGFTNGCFDLMHAGHLSLLRQAKAGCDKLIVGINSDASIKRLKGEARPVNGEMERAMLLGALAMVDMVVIFREDTPEQLIARFRPDLLVKGADYTKAQVVGGALVESYGGKIMLADLQEGYSTTHLIRQMQNAP